MIKILPRDWPACDSSREFLGGVYGSIWRVEVGVYEGRGGRRRRQPEGDDEVDEVDEVVEISGAVEGG